MGIQRNLGYWTILHSYVESISSDQEPSLSISESFPPWPNPDFCREEDHSFATQFTNLLKNKSKPVLRVHLYKKVPYAISQISNN